MDDVVKKRLMDMLFGILISIYCGWILAQIIIGYLEEDMK